MSGRKELRINRIMRNCSTKAVHKIIGYKMCIHSTQFESNYSQLIEGPRMTIRPKNRTWTKQWITLITCVYVEYYNYYHTWKRFESIIGTHCFAWELMKLKKRYSMQWVLVEKISVYLDAKNIVYFVSLFN